LRPLARWKSAFHAANPEASRSFRIASRNRAIWFQLRMPGDANAIPALASPAFDVSSVPSAEQRWRRESRVPVARASPGTRWRSNVARAAPPAGDVPGRSLCDVAGRPRRHCLETRASFVHREELEPTSESALVIGLRPRCARCRVAAARAPGVRSGAGVSVSPRLGRASGFPDTPGRVAVWT